MARNSKYTLFLFYSNSNQQSLRARVAINEFVSESIEWADVTVKEIDYERAKDVARENGVLGTPAIVIFKDGNIVRRHLGEITFGELQAMVKEL